MLMMLIQFERSVLSPNVSQETGGGPSFPELSKLCQSMVETCSASTALTWDMIAASAYNVHARSLYSSRQDARAKKLLGLRIRKLMLSRLRVHGNRSWATLSGRKPEPSKKS